MPVKVLIRFVHGLGDCVQFSVVLKHLRRYRPDWEVDVRLGRGKHTALIGLCHRVYHDQERDPVGPYDSVAELGWYENYSGYPDRPNSKITNCLAEVFGLQWDPALACYQVHDDTVARHRASAYLRHIGCTAHGDRHNAVIIHYEGNTSPPKKNLGHWQAQAMCELAIRAGRIPIILDWDGRSPLPDQKKIFKPPTGPDDIWGGFGSGDAATIAALIRSSEAYIGVDSGPGKIASACTGTPSLICWRGHHPVQFHDPAPDTVHLVPEDHLRMAPCGGNSALGEFFAKNYRFRTYAGEHGLVAVAQQWLAEVLGCTELAGGLPVSFVLPNGIGDVLWALTKIKYLAAGRPIDVILAGDPRREIDHRAVPFLRRFPFIRDVSVLDIPILEDKENPTDSRGRYRYVSDGVRGSHHYLMPNRPLEAGRRLEDWLPETPTDWKIMDEFNWATTERGKDLGKGLSPMVAFYLGPEAGHCDEGHNRGWLWEPKHWIELGAAFAERGFQVAVVGAHYDRSFFENYVQKAVAESGQVWADLIGRFEIGETLAFLKEAKCFISYQCGLGVCANYLGINTAMFWRPDGDSAHQDRLVCFAEAMKDAWTRPEWPEKYIGMIYTKVTPASLMEEIDRREWLK